MGKSAPCIFNRDEEMRQLATLLSSEPEYVHVLLGPPSCGKTTLLQRLASQHYRGRVSHDGNPPGWLDGRVAQLGSPQVMAQSLHEMIVKEKYLPRALRALAPKQFNVGLSIPGAVGLKFGATRKDREQVPGARQMTESAEKLFSKYNEKKAADSPWPLLVIDEANRMQGWSPGSDRGDIMAFLVHVTKTKHNAHVILSTSDFSFLDWICQELGSLYIRVLVLGEFTRDEAKSFFMEHMGRQTKVPASSVTEDEWVRIFQVCGGNPGMLRSAVNRFLAGMNWGRSLQDLVQPVLKTCVIPAQQGKDFGSGIAYTTQQFKKVATTLLTVPHHAVPWDNLACEIGGMGAQGMSIVEAELRGGLALRAMVKANVLAHRPQSELSRDLPDEVFAEGDACTALTPGHLEAMRILQEKGRL